MSNSRQENQNAAISRGQLRRLQKQLVGRKVAFRRLVGNSLLIYLECEPGDKTGFVIWLEPCWHFCGPSKVLVGSYQSELAAGPHQAEGFKKIAPLLDRTIGRKVASVHIEPYSNDLRVQLGGGYWLETFVDDPASNENWHVTDNVSGLTVYASPSGLRVLRKRGRPTPGRSTTAKRMSV